MPNLRKYLYKPLGYRQLGNNRGKHKPSPEGEEIEWFTLDVSRLDTNAKLSL